MHGGKMQNQELYLSGIKEFTLSNHWLVSLWDFITVPFAKLMKLKRNKAIDAVEPPGLDGHFLIGLMPEFSRDPLRFFHSIWFTYARAEGICRFKLANRTIYLVTNPILCQTVAQESDTYVRGSLFDKNRRVLGDSLLTAEGQVWKKKRNDITPHLNVKAIKENHYSIIQEVCEVLINRLYGRLRVGVDTLDVFEELSSCTIEVISQSLLGVHLSSHYQECRKALEVILNHVFATVVSVVPPGIRERLPTKANRRYKEAVVIAKKEFLKSIQEQLAKGRDNYLIQRFREEGDLTQELFNDILNVFLAGYETTAQLLSWTIYELSRRPQIDEKLYHELASRVHGSIPTLEELVNLPYLANVIQEVLRIYPPAPLVVRDVVKDAQLGKYAVAKGDAVFIGLAMMGQDNARWNNPLEFNPDRFTTELLYKPFQYDLVPFGIGVHKCVGQQLSLTEAKCILASLVAKFQFESEECVNPVMRGTLQAEKRLTVRIKERNAPQMPKKQPVQHETRVSGCPFHRLFEK